MSLVSSVGYPTEGHACTPVASVDLRREYIWKFRSSEGANCQVGRLASAERVNRRVSAQVRRHFELRSPGVNLLINNGGRRNELSKRAGDLYHFRRQALQVISDQRS
jgi:hypothetical protein